MKSIFFYKKAHTALILLLALLVINACKSKTIKPEKATELSFIETEVEIPSFNFKATVKFNGQQFAKINLNYNNKADSSFYIYLHKSVNDEKKETVNAMFFKVNADESLTLLADNLNDIYGESRALSKRNPSAFLIKINRINWVNGGDLGVSDACCTVTCSNGLTMKCCGKGTCCSDSANGCPQCCN